MLKRILTLGSLAILSAILIRAQCPDKDSLWKRLIFLRSASTISTADQLKELLHYEQLIRNCSYPSDTVRALLLQRIGVMYSYQSDYLKALQYLHQSVKVNTSRTGQSSVSVSELIRSYYNLYRVYAELGRANERVSAADSCVSIALKTGVVDVYSLFPLTKKVEYLFDVGDYQRAFSAAEMGESIIRKYSHGADSIDFIIGFLTWKVNALVFLKDYELAEKIVTDKINDCKSIGANQYLGNLYEQLGMVLSHKKDYAKAERCFQDAFQFHRNDKYDLGCGQTLTNWAFCLYYEQYRDYKKAIVTYKHGLKYINRAKVPKARHTIETLNIYAEIANAFVQLGFYDSAFYYFQRAFDQIKPGIGEEDLLHIPLDEFAELKQMTLIVSLLIGKGDAYLKRFKETKNLMLADEAIRIYKASDLLINKIKSEQSEVLSKLFWRSNSHLLYEHAIEACYLTNNMTDAFFFFEKSRAVLLNDQLNEQHWMSESDILKNIQVKKKIVLLERELDTTSNSSKKYAELQNELFSDKMELDRLVNSIKDKNPLYYQGFLDSSTITPQEVQKNLLKNHEAFVEFFSGDSNIYCYVVTKDKMHLTRIDKNALESSIHIFNALISNQDVLNRRFSDYISTSENIYKLIFKDNPVPDGRIIISLDGNYFPFEALVISHFPHVDYFLDDHAVTYTYSAKYLLNQFATSSDGSSRNFIAIAPVRFYSTSLAALPGSDRSVQKLKSYFTDADDLVSVKASKSNFLRLFSKYKIIQLYTHAISNSEFGEPVIYFSDSALYLSDLIREERPATRLIMLSACETAKGRFYQGEGVFSFNRGFAAIGIPSSVTNLWSVENESTYRITELFYKYLSNGLSTDLALQNAKKEFKRTVSGEKKLPYYWAASILIGKVEGIELRKAPARGYVLVASAMAVIFLLGLVIFMKKKKTSSTTGLQIN